MAKWFGKVGYVRTENDGTGVWKRHETEIEYY